MKMKTKTVALYHSVACDFDSIFQVNDHMESHIDWVRISEPVEVELPLLPEDAVGNAKIEALKEQKAEVMQQVAAIDEEIRKLLALPAPLAD